MPRKKTEVGGKHIVMLNFSKCLNNLVGRLNCGWLLFSTLDKNVEITNVCDGIQEIAKKVVLFKQ